MQYVDCLLRHMLAFETKKCERCQARRGHASALDYSRKIPSPEPPSAMVSLALYKMLLLLNQTARETPIINSSTRLSSNLEIKCWTMFKALYTPSLPYTLFASLCSITDSNFFNSWVKVLTNTSEILPCNRTSIILALIFRTLLHTSGSTLPYGEATYNSDGETLRAGTVCYCLKSTQLLTHLSASQYRTATDTPWNHCSWKVPQETPQLVLPASAVNSPRPSGL